MSTRTTHHELSESIAAYALDALDGAERAALEAHLRECTPCREDVRAYRDVAAMLAHAAPAAPAAQLANRDAVRQRLLLRARETRRDSRPDVLPLSSARSRRSRWPYLTWTAAAAALALAMATGIAYRKQQGNVARLQAELASTRAAFAARDSALAALLGPEVHVVSLSQPERKPSARVFWNHTRNVFVVTAFDVPPAPAGKTYQLWAISKGKAPASMGTFTPRADGRAAVILPVPASITGAGFIDDCALTLEPEGGSPQPTETPRLIGSWRHTD